MTFVSKEGLSGVDDQYIAKQKRTMTRGPTYLKNKSNRVNEDSFIAEEDLEAKIERDRRRAAEE